MNSFTKNIVSLITLVCFILGSGLTAIGIFRSGEIGGNQLDETFIIPSQVLNGLTVMFLLYLTSTNTTFGAFYKLLIILLLVGGMFFEIYLSSYGNEKSESIAAYVFISLNFLIRSFFLLELAQSEWIVPRQTIDVLKDNLVKPIQDVVKDMAKSAPRVDLEDKPSSDSISDYKDRFREILKEAKSKNPDIDSSTIQREAWPVIDVATKAGEFTNEHLKEALNKVKNKDGSSISGVSVGGRKRS